MQLAYKFSYSWTYTNQRICGISVKRMFKCKRMPLYDLIASRNSERDECELIYPDCG